MTRIRELDAIRALCELWVVMGLLGGPPLASLEDAGQWSYSVYLTHLCANVFVVKFGLPDFGAAMNRPIRMALVLGMGYLCYKLVEYPAHKLARFAGQTFGNAVSRGA